MKWNNATTFDIWISQYQFGPYLCVCVRARMPRKHKCGTKEVRKKALHNWSPFEDGRRIYFLVFDIDLSIFNSCTYFVLLSILIWRKVHRMILLSVSPYDSNCIENLVCALKGQSTDASIMYLLPSLWLDFIAVWSKCCSRWSATLNHSKY